MHKALLGPSFALLVATPAAAEQWKVEPAIVAASAQDDFETARAGLARQLAECERAAKERADCMALILWSSHIASQDGDRAAGQQFARRALEMAERTFGGDHFHTGQAHFVLGFSVEDDRNMHAAITHYRRALAIYGKALPVDHPQITIALDSLAYALTRGGEWSEASKLYEQAIAIEERARPDQTAFIAGFYGKLASNESALLRLSSAERSSAKAIELLARTVSSDDPLMLAALSERAGILQHLDRVGEAEQLYRQVIAARERAVPQDADKLASDSEKLARLLLEQGRLAEGVVAMMTARDLLLKQYPASNPRFLSLLALAGQALSKIGEFEGAEQSWRKVIEIRQTMPGDQRDAIAHAESMLGGALTNQKKYAEGEALIRKALAQRQAMFPADHPFVFFGKSTLASNLMNQKRYAEAAAIYRELLPTARGMDRSGTIRHIGPTMLAICLEFSGGDPAEIRALYREATGVILEQVADRRISDAERSERVRFMRPLFTRDVSFAWKLAERRAAQN